MKLPNHCTICKKPLYHGGITCSQKQCRQAYRDRLKECRDYTPPLPKLNFLMADSTGIRTGR